MQHKVSIDDATQGLHWWWCNTRSPLMTLNQSINQSIFHEEVDFIYVLPTIPTVALITNSRIDHANQNHHMDLTSLSSNAIHHPYPNSTLCIAWHYVCLIRILPHTTPLLRIQGFFFFFFHIQAVLSVSHTALHVLQSSIRLSSIPSISTASNYIIDKWLYFISIVINDYISSQLW